MGWRRSLRTQSWEKRERNGPPHSTSARSVSVECLRAKASACKEVAPHIAAVVGGEEGQGFADPFGITQAGTRIVHVERLPLRLSRLAQLSELQFGLDTAGANDVDGGCPSAQGDFPASFPSR